MNLSRIMNELQSYEGEEIKIMEVCGTHTSSIFKNGIRNLISPRIHLISGPGCPVCVTPTPYIDRLVELSLLENHCILTFGDMMKVKGTSLSLSDAKALGARVKILYSPLTALKETQNNPHIQYIFAAVGFETTAPLYAVLLDEIIQNKIKNLTLLTSIKTILPALRYICEIEKGINAFLCPGHVSVITGAGVYREIAEKYGKPFVIAGFEGEHILAAIAEIVHQLKKKEYHMKNMYVSAVSEEGNQKATEMVSRYFEKEDAIWRGIGLIPGSGLKLRKEFIKYSAEGKEYNAGGAEYSADSAAFSEDLTENIAEGKQPAGCSCTDILLGRKSPKDCPLFDSVCTPFNAMGPCMVSSEGACGIWYRHREV